ncbi:putative GDP-mannose-dependent alpha-mannosyltransferase [Streptomyces afghaniensis 772]|uniref:Putative GDP-mannose-dependent alpha-mannosyltransferase n=1 Tax=Streptomyces afghaniensis 772 TaxID=1283301 RepID=S4MA93_9ACTN|nr:putative GDP-mannose-dependent alpha-mannosyltransferase [Streptomyces afghaniensis 772]
MHEGVQRGEDPGQIVAGTAAEEDRAGQRLLQAGPARAVADDHDPDALQAAGPGEEFDLLLGGEPADVADDQLAVRGEFAAQGLVPAVGPETFGVDAARPQRDPGHTVRLQVAQGRAGRGEGEVGGAVHGADPPPGGGFSGTHVRTGVSGQVGLVDGDGGDAEAGGDGHAAHAEDEGAGEVDDIGTVLDEGGGQAAAGEGDADLGVAGEREGGDVDDGARRVGVGLVPGRGGRGDDDGGVTAIDEVPGGLERAVGHAVHIGGKGFGHDDDTHRGVLAVPDVAASTWIFPDEERPMSVLRRTRAGQAASIRS